MNSSLDKKCSDFLAEVKRAATKYSGAFVIIAEIQDDDNDDTRTVSTWDGGFNTANGLAARAVERMRRAGNESDYPDDPPEGEDWKAEA